MNNLVRINPIRDMVDFQNEINRLFTPVADAEKTALVPMDVIENEHSFIVKAILPGIDPDAISIILENNLLTIKGETAAETENENETFHLRERRFGSFYRSLKFRTQVDAAAVSAAYKQGILTLHIPKAEAAKAKRITINNNQ